MNTLFILWAFGIPVLALAAWFAFRKLRAPVRASSDAELFRRVQEALAYAAWTDRPSVAPFRGSSLSRTAMKSALDAFSAELVENGSDAEREEYRRGLLWLHEEIAGGPVLLSEQTPS